MFLCPSALSAQNGITISNFSANAGTLTFDVRWDKNTMPAVWIDTAWVFVDYNNAGIMTRLQVSGATVSPGTAHIPNNQGAWVHPGAGISSAAVRLLTTTAPADLPGACAYAVDYPPVGNYTAAGKIKLTGTPPYKLTFSTGSIITAGKDETAGTYTITESGKLVAFTDATGAPGVINCKMPAAQTLTASYEAYCIGTDGVNLALSGTEDGAVYQLYKNDALLPGATIAGTGGAATFSGYFLAGTYRVETEAGAFCPVAMNGTRTITENPLPTPPQLNTPANVCQDAGTIVFVASGHSGTADWSLSSGGAADGASYTFTSAASGTKSVTVRSAQTHTNAPTCFSSSLANGAATVYAKPSVPSLSLSPSTRSTVPGTYTASGGSGNYEWSGYFAGRSGATQYTASTKQTYTTSVRSKVIYGTSTCYSGWSTERSYTLADPTPEGGSCSSSSQCANGSCKCSYCITSAATCSSSYVYYEEDYDDSCASGFGSSTSCTAAGSANWTRGSRQYCSGGVGGYTVRRCVNGEEKVDDTYGTACGGTNYNLGYTYKLCYRTR
jgi:hypothetical protein